jgi:chemotaxis protein histidine kinase CheA
MFIVEDVTEVEKLERAMAEERAKSNRSMQIIQELAGMPRAQIGDFLGRSVESVSEVKQLLQSQAKPDFDLVFRHLHTVKGNARGFKLNMISGAAHRVESLVAPCRGGQGSQTWLSSRDQIFDELFQLQQQLGDYTDLAQRVLGIDSKRHGANGNETASAANANPSHALISALRPLLERMGQQVKHPLMAEVEALLEAASRAPVRPTLEQLKYMALDLAQELGKNVEVEIVDVGDTALKPAVLAPVQDALMHLVRNAVDHGLEAPSDRKDAGKSTQGKITLACVESSDGITIRVDDDGRGLDAEAIAIRAGHLGLVSEDALRAMSSTEKLALIFLPGFTTKREVSEISGRGSGLDAAKVDIEKSGGRIDIKTEPGRGTTFAIVFAKRQHARATGAA